MNNKRDIWTIIASVMGLSILILDTKTALLGSRSGIELCIRSVIPSLFPFLFLSFIFNQHLLGRKFPVPKCVRHIYGIPEGCESLLLLGIFGGYPVGAQAIYTAYDNRCIDKRAAQRLLAFCNNAGPAFIFGILSAYFTKSAVVWSIWLIHISSAIAVGALIPKPQQTASSSMPVSTLSLPKALERAIRSIATISGWVIIFRVLIEYVNRFALKYLAEPIAIILTGVLELTNGCCSLSTIPSEAQRFILSTFFLSIGGICVFLQTVSVTKELGTGMYLQGKLTQALLSLLAAIITAKYFYPDDAVVAPISIGILTILLIISIIFLRKSSSIAENNVV